MSNIILLKPCLASNRSLTFMLKIFAQLWQMRLHLCVMWTGIQSGVSGLRWVPVSRNKSSPLLMRGSFNWKTLLIVNVKGKTLLERFPSNDSSTEEAEDLKEEEVVNFCTYMLKFRSKTFRNHPYIVRYVFNRRVRFVKR